MRPHPGSPTSLGARWDGRGVNVAVPAAPAQAVWLCLFADAPGGGFRETARLPLPERTGDVFHGFFPELRPGQLYGLRVDGPWDPARGVRCNPHKLLLDPWALAVAGPLVWEDAVYAHAGGAAVPPTADGPPDERDSALFVPRGVIVDPTFDWEDDRPPRVPWSRTVIGEAHVRALTLRHPGVPEAHRGRYLGVCAPPVIEHLRSLGVTTLELMPVHHFVSERRLVQAGLVNAWGYNPLAFLAPHAGYASGDRGQQVREFRQMVKALHRAGLEVLLDVVFNHTAESGSDGPSLSLRGLDDAGFYRHRPEDPRLALDLTGCGNTLNAPHPRALQLVLDALRHWAGAMHVDGFRFDLAPVLSRGPALEHLDTFWHLLQADPVLAGCKLVVEPWDLGPDGWRTGRMPAGLAQWNDRFRDVLRGFWRGDRGLRPELASRLAGSSDLFEAGPTASVNFVTAHDGFTLLDLVSHAAKHNEANGEGNRDGHDANRSRNWGVEGPTGDPAVLALRDRVRRSLWASGVLSQGVTLLRLGDELSHTQGGNNNAYCQDGPTTWLDWSLDERARAFLGFTRELAGIAASHPVLRRRSFFRGRLAGHVAAREEHAQAADGPLDPAAHDVFWLGADGRPLRDADWNRHDARALGVLLPGEHADEVDEAGRPLRGATLLLLLNGGEADLDLRLPRLPDAGGWRLLVDTAREPAASAAGLADLPPAALALTVPAHALLLLERIAAEVRPGA
jgi:glycogen operon protein